MNLAMPLQLHCSEENFEKISKTIVEDGEWHKLIVDMYYRLFEIIENLPSSDDSDYTDTLVKLRCSLRSLRYAFGTVVNITDGCRNVVLQKQIFEQFLRILTEELSFQRLLKVRDQLDNTISQHLLGISSSLITIIHNFVLYYEQSISVLQDYGMMSKARKLRESSKDSYLKTCALLIIAHLLKDDDDKEQMKMNDGELSYLINELEKSMRKTRESGYHPEELIEGLSRIAVIDANKLKLIENGILPLLKQSIVADRFTPKHQEATINAIRRLAFTDESKQKIKDQENLLAGW